MASLNGTDAVMTGSPGPSDPKGEAAAVIARYLREGDEITRCHAAKALGSVGSAAAAVDLVAALLDEDPDVRSDAMAALRRCARPVDAAGIRRSLIGDPVAEVKVAAVRALARLGDREAIPLLRRLARDRFEEQVVWEDGAGMWDDWLDVQLAAVEALGEMGATEAIEDLLAARCDEMEQDLDSVVFAALARMPQGGVAALIDLLQNGAARVRARALAALAKASPAALAHMIGQLLADADPEVRLLVVACMAPDDRRLADVAGRDPDSRLRCRALAICAGPRPEIAQAALSDPAEDVRAMALEQLAVHKSWPRSDDLVANLLAWLQTGGERLASVSASVLPNLDPVGAAAPLLGLAQDADRPIAARVAALRGLETLETDGLTQALTELATDASRALRTAALTVLARRCDGAADPEERRAAETAVSQAIGGEFGENPGVEAEAAIDRSDVAASKVEDAGAGRIAITPDGEIVDRAPSPDLVDEPQESDGNVIRGHFPQSTLEAIQAPVTSPPTDDDVALSDSDLSFLELAQGGRRRGRVSVDGPAEIADDIRIVALRVAARSGGVEVEQAIAAALDSSQAPVRIAAFEALAQRALARPISPALLPAVANALGDPAPVVRGLATRILRDASPDAAECLVDCLDDSDATVRAEALQAVAKDASQTRLVALSDRASIVRQTALQLVLDHGDDEEMAEALEICASAGDATLIRQTCTLSDLAGDLLLASLSSENLGLRQARTILDAMS